MERFDTSEALKPWELRPEVRILSSPLRTAYVTSCMRNYAQRVSRLNTRAHLLQRSIWPATHMDMQNSKPRKATNSNQEFSDQNAPRWLLTLSPSFVSLSLSVFPLIQSAKAPLLLFASKLVSSPPFHWPIHTDSKSKMATPCPLPFLFLLLFSLLPSPALSRFNISGLLIDCGVNTSYTDDRGLRWLPDSQYITSGVSKNLSTLGLQATFSTLRSFPFNASSPRKFCYNLPSYKGGRYLVRTSYFFDGPGEPPVFDLIVDANLWTMVNTTADYAAGSASYYEGVFQAKGRYMNVCVAGNPNYTKGDPFISALELIMLNDSVYNATDFDTKAMGLIARNKFGAVGDIER